MRSCLFFILIASFISSISFAAIRRVGYTGPALAGVDYSSLVAARDASSAGDTIQVYGSIGGADITKRLVIMGFGYNFDVNTGLQAIGNDVPSSITGTLSFQPGSEGSILEGCHVSSGVQSDDILFLFTSNITIKRCFVGWRVRLRNEARPVNNIKLISCVVRGSGTPGGGGVSMNNSAINPCLNFQMYNCILGGDYNFYLSGSTGSLINCVTPLQPSGIALASFNFNSAGFLIKNCFIAAPVNPSNTSTIYENNFFTVPLPSIPPAGHNNRWNQSSASLFTRLGTGNDNASIPGDQGFDEDYFTLITGSPAINGGFDNANNPTDCGIYGGEAAYRYKLSGVPAVPAIYKLTAPSSAATSNPYNVTISVRSNN